MQSAQPALLSLIKRNSYSPCPAPNFSADITLYRRWMPYCIQQLVCLYSITPALSAFKDYFPPSQPPWLLAHAGPTGHSADDQLGFALHTITGFHRPGLTHYYGFICHLTPTFFLCHHLKECFQLRLERMPGFLGYCTNSLLEIPPSAQHWFV